MGPTKNPWPLVWAPFQPRVFQNDWTKPRLARSLTCTALIAVLLVAMTWPTGQLVPRPKLHKKIHVKRRFCFERDFSLVFFFQISELNLS